MTNKWYTILLLLVVLIVSAIAVCAASGPSCKPACVTGETCVKGECVQVHTCTKNTDCTDPEICDARKGYCVSNPKACDDKNVCTSYDTTVKGKCVGTPVAEGTQCTDANGATGSCVGGVCTISGLVCDPSCVNENCGYDVTQCAGPTECSITTCCPDARYGIAYWGDEICCPVGTNFDQTNGCVATCGDGIMMDAWEDCDDGNIADGDGCSSTCTIEPSWTCTHIEGELSVCTQNPCDPFNPTDPNAKQCPTDTTCLYPQGGAGDAVCCDSAHSCDTGGTGSICCWEGWSCCNGNCCGDGLCINNQCYAEMPTCTDNVKNGYETDVDCGGNCPNKCDVDKACLIDADCVSGTCTNNACVGFT